MRVLSAFFVVALALASTRSASADAPPLIPVQGYLTDPSGAPLNGNYNIRFRLYGSASGGSPLFEESPGVAVDHGRFVHYLGTEEALDLALVRDHPTLYLGVRIGNDAEATPLVELASVPYAAFAQFCGDSRTVAGQSAAQLHDYGSLTNVPSTFSPSAHTHAVADVTGAQAVLANACPTGSSIRAIDPSGAVTCETDDDVPYTSGVGVVVNPDRSLSLDTNVVRSTCFDSEAELLAALGDDYAPLVHTHSASQITGSFADLTATGTVTASAVTATGTVTGAGFVYPSRATRYQWVAASEFQYLPGHASKILYGGPNWFALMSTGQWSVPLMASIDLPDGAVITKIDCHVLEQSQNYDFTALTVVATAAVQPAMSGAPTPIVLASGPSASTSGYNINNTVVATATGSGPAIDNSSRTTELRFDYLTNGPEGTERIGFFSGCRVTYTVASPN